MKLATSAGVVLGAVAAFPVLDASAQVMTEQQRRTALLPYIRAATNCIAQSALQIPAAAEAAQQNRGWDLLQATHQRCLDELARMAQAHDALHGANTGMPFVRGPYATDLPRAVLTRIQPELTRRAEEAAKAEALRRAEQERQAAQARQVEDERKKLLVEAEEEHQACLSKQMVEILPYSSEPAETIATAVMAKCSDHESKRVRLVAALFSVPASEVSPLLSRYTDEVRKTVVTAIVTIRAEIAKNAIQSPSGPSSSTPAGRAY